MKNNTFITNTFKIQKSVYTTYQLIIEIYCTTHDYVCMLVLTKKNV